jgi:uncharacterized protein (TIGR02444 family)
VKQIKEPILTNSANPFWAFSLKFYCRKGVASSCLELQESFGADVNILLYCCWIAFEGAEEIEPAELAVIIATIEPWQSVVVQRLREIRVHMKQDEMVNLGALSEELRQVIKTCELDAEKIEQTILYQSGRNIKFDASMSRAIRIYTAKQNLHTYLQLILRDVPEDSYNLIQDISQKVGALLAL